MKKNILKTLSIFSLISIITVLAILGQYKVMLAVIIGILLIPIIIFYINQK